MCAFRRSDCLVGEVPPPPKHPPHLEGHVSGGDGALHLRPALRDEDLDVGDVGQPAGGRVQPLAAGADPGDDAVDDVVGHVRRRVRVDGHDLEAEINRFCHRDSQPKGREGTQKWVAGTQNWFFLGFFLT